MGRLPGPILVTVAIPAGWVTDVEVLRLGGSVVEAHREYSVVRSPHNPGHHWGNFVLVTDRRLALHADLCLQVFAEEFPDADHTAIGLPTEPDPGPWRARGAEVESELMLEAGEPCAPRILPAGYHVRQLGTGSDWDAVVAVDLADARASGLPMTDRFQPYLVALWGTRAQMGRRGRAAFFGAFADSGELVARLGIVLCGPMGVHRQVARYQHVITSAEHRDRGLAGHLLGVAGRWAAGAGADRWEIHVSPGTAAHRLYSGLGFTLAGQTWQAYHAPQPPVAG